MTTRLTTDLTRFMLYRLLRDAQWEAWGIEPDAIHVGPIEVGPNEIAASMTLSFKTSDSNGGWWTDWEIRIPVGGLGDFRVWPKDAESQDNWAATAPQTIDMNDLGRHMLEYETVGDLD
jgi:hypothetical protein